MDTNAEIYKTAKEREIAFRHFCRSSRDCDGCSIRYSTGKCEFLWLELEAKYSRLSQCPFCGTEDIRVYSESNSDGKLFWARCCGCGAMSVKLKRNSMRLKDGKKEFEEITMETIEDIKQELRCISERASGANKWNKNCVTTYPTIAGKQLWSYFADLADRIEAAVEYTLAVEKAKAAGEGYAAGVQSVTDCNQHETVDIEGRCVYGAAKDAEPIGNAAKMREALEKCANMGEQIDCQLGSSDATVYAFRHERCLAHNISECARAALSAPPRNCDSFNTGDPMKDAEDAYGAWQRYCDDPTIPPSCKVESAFKDWLFAEAKGE